ncbi:hypothetical protein GPECTOR_13g837 [Gonium pectorale]|uniref:GST C-terminal domain-containing protein n=1 Tax=Gonium pectorale TaxID=33097 RepID=A0A150GNF2_GONPE|nr:hypothetical protein GPECTOR_13g837 [Gonium pectorale]|eukprot:KXZ51349.1 hypothetical protein GPECTOR_13g837 [Gonium pectorale]
MHTIQAPPGHPGQPAALIAYGFLEQQLTIDAPDPDLPAPVLKAGEHTAHGTTDILRHGADRGSGGHLGDHGVGVAATHSGSSLYPEELKGSIDKWLVVAATLEAVALAWVEPFAGKADDKAREDAKSAATTALEQIKVDLTAEAGRKFLTGASATIADVAVASALSPLFGSVLGKPLQAHFGPVLAWLGACHELPQFAKALGERRRIEGVGAMEREGNGRRRVAKGR